MMSFKSRKLILRSAVPEGIPRPKNVGQVRAVTKLAVGMALFATTGASFLALAPSASAASSAPTHGTSSCSIAGDECSNAISYANQYQGGGATVLAVEADTEAHSTGVTHRIFDVRIQTNSGIYVEHVYRNDSAPYNDTVWWANRAENQNQKTGAGTTTSPSSGSSTSPDSSPDSSNNADANNPDTKIDQAASYNSSASSTSNSAQQITSVIAVARATSFVQGQGYQVLGVKRSQLNSSGQKDYFQIKLQLGLNGHMHDTANVWVDASSSAGIVTAASGGGLNYRDTFSVPILTAQSNAIAAVGGGSAFHNTKIHGDKWRWYWVFVRNGTSKYKIGVSAVTGQVTQVQTN